MIYDNISNIEFDIVEGCNLRCKYCYLQSGTRNYSNHSNRMPFDVFDNFFNKFKESNCTEKQLNISFWGGEPLLAFDQIKYIIDSFETIKDNCKKITYLIITNGTVINNDIIKLCIEKNILLQITLDGYMESHDAYRFFDTHKGSFSMICKNIKTLRREGVRYFLRTTITNKTPRPKELLKYYIDNGISPIKIDTRDNMILSSYKGGGIGYGIVNSVIEGDKDILELSPKIDEIPKIVDSIIDSYNKDKHSGKLYYHSNINRLYDQFLWPAKKKNCGVGHKKITIRYDGSIYLCHRFASDLKFSIGDVWNGIDKDKFNEYKKLYCNSVDTNIYCKNCQYRYECGGACFHETIIYGINYINNYLCEFNKNFIVKSFSYFLENGIDAYEISFAKSTERMLMKPRKILIKSNDTNCIDLDSDGIITSYTKDTPTRFIANTTAMAIWDLIDGQRTAQQIAQEIATVCEVEFEAIKDDIYGQLAAFQELGLVEEVQAESHA